MNSLDGIMAPEHPEMDEQTFQQVLSRLPINVRVPRSLQGLLTPDEITASCYADQRQFARFNKLSRGLLKRDEQRPSEEDAPAWHLVLITDISRLGIGLLHSEPLAPGPERNLWISGPENVRFHVVRCTRVNDQCYRIGARLTEPFQAKSLRRL